MTTVRFKANLKRAAINAEVTTAGAAGLGLALEYLLTEANKIVPHDEGTLERSGSTDVDGLRGAVSYDTPYAARQHEDMAYRHDGKGQAKWLESTLDSNGNTAVRIIAQAMKAKIGG